MLIVRQYPQKENSIAKIMPLEAYAQTQYVGLRMQER
jgi:hypothetical protein